jgi:hypothetical protein
MRLLAFVLAAVASLAVTANARADDDDWSNSPKVLACAPRVLKHGGAVTLTLGPNHGAEMAIRRPGLRDWYFLVVGDATPAQKPLMTSQQLKAARRVVLTEASGSGLNDGLGDRVFSQPGRYTVYLSNKLESEAGGNICTIDYKR